MVISNFAAFFFLSFFRVIVFSSVVFLCQRAVAYFGLSLCRVCHHCPQSLNGGEQEVDASSLVIIELVAAAVLDYAGRARPAL